MEMTEEQLQQAFRLFVHHKVGLAKIPDILGLPFKRNVLRRLLNERFPALANRRVTDATPFPDEVVEKIRRLREEGWSYPAIYEANDGFGLRWGQFEHRVHKQIGHLPRKRGDGSYFNMPKDCNARRADPSLDEEFDHSYLEDADFARAKRIRDELAQCPPELRARIQAARRRNANAWGGNV